MCKFQIKLLILSSPFSVEFKIFNIKQLEELSDNVSGLWMTLFPFSRGRKQPFQMFLSGFSVSSL